MFILNNKFIFANDDDKIKYILNYKLYYYYNINMH